MPYLTHEEYKGFGFNEIVESEFNRLVKKASDAIDGITSDFYQFHNLDTDVDYRKIKFKKAVAAQIEYFHDMGATSSHELNSPLSVQIGRTQMSVGDNNQRKINKNNVSEEAYTYLRNTGLLYQGLG